MATANQMIDYTDFGTTTKDGSTYLTVNMDGENVVFWDDTRSYYGGNTISFDFNMSGPEGGIPFPFVGTLFPDSIGWAMNANDGNDTVTGHTLSDALAGGADHDLIKGMAGSDILHGETGNDTLYGGVDDDWIYGGWDNDVVYGEAGNDYLDGGDGTDLMDGGLGNDTYVLENTTDSVIEGVNGGTDVVQSLLASTTLGANLENLKMLFAGYSEGYGNAGNNVITGSVWSNTIDAAAGNDTVFASFGNDTVHGNTGHDYLVGEVGDDRLFGDDGDDVLEGSGGVDWSYGGAGNDLIRSGDGSDFAYGGAGNDTVYGDFGGTTANSDYLYGDAGNDLIWGDGDNDMLRGGDGTDILHGGEGNDTVHGEAGVDLMYGEAGADRFVFRATTDAPMSGLDRIMDFVHGVDLIDLSALDANSAMAGNQAFSFTGAKPFFASAGDLSFTAGLLGSLVEGDLNGDGMSDFRILVVGNYTMSASDFIL